MTEPIGHRRVCSWPLSFATIAISIPFAIASCGGEGDEPDPGVFEGAASTTRTACMPEQFPTTMALLAVSGGTSFTLALVDDDGDGDATTGSVWGWGDNLVGALGCGKLATSSAPVIDDPVRVVKKLVDGTLVPLTGIKAISAGAHAAFAVHKDGKVFAWGAEGDLADGHEATEDIEVSHRPWADYVQTSAGVPLTNVSAVDAGPSHTLAISSGYVYSWGYNYNGSVGCGTCPSGPDYIVWATKVLNSQNQPISGIVDIAAGEGHSLAVGSSGTVYAWGSDANGQLGNGTSDKSQHNSAIVIPSSSFGGRRAKTVAATNDESLVLDSAGQVWGFGRNEWGELANGTTVQKESPTKSKLTGIFFLAAGSDFGLAVKYDNTAKAYGVLAWGSNEEYQLGSSRAGQPSACTGDISPCYPNPGPVLMSNGKALMLLETRELMALDPGSRHGAILKSNRFWGWGSNFRRQVREGCSTYDAMSIPYATQGEPYTASCP